LLTCLAFGAAALGCSRQTQSVAEHRSDVATSGTRTDEHEVLATIGSKQITMVQIRAKAGEQLEAMDLGYARARHKLIETTLQKILRDSLVEVEARTRGKSVEDLLAAEAGGTLSPSNAEILAWYDENRDRVGGRTLDQTRAAIAAFLYKQRRDLAMQSLGQRLEREHNVTVSFGPWRFELDNTDAPARGPNAAPITLVEFSDFECPFCAGFRSILSQVERAFGDTVRVVYRQFPLSGIHPHAQKAAEASLCANDQRKFWQMHDALFDDQAHLEVADLKQRAGRLGLDQQRFDKCLDSGRYVEQIEKDEQQGRLAGVTGTPALFINGIPVEGGAVSYDALAAAIHQELQRRGR
jgi:protein-disulfide isomerase